jgi:protein-S-isoprenylcysteine O-methyltransferase Ste14
VLFGKVDQAPAAEVTMPGTWRALAGWLASTPNRTFVVYPICVAAFELALQQGWPRLEPLGAVLLVWGYGQYRWTGAYRTRIGKGGPGTAVPPERLVTGGPYRYLRNPMYLGHLIFMAGLAVTFRSWLALAFLVVHMFWFHQRVREDEDRLSHRFGADYEDYKGRVKRWIPGIW